MQLVSKITISQQPSVTYPNRSDVYTMDFVNEITIKTSWYNTTNTAKVIMPKNVYVQTPNGNKAWESTNIYAGSDVPPIFLRGDKIKIELGYYYENASGNMVTETNNEFEGFISKVNPKIPMEIDCEDNMWLLKQALCPNKVFPNFKSTDSAVPSTQYNTTQIIRYLLDNAIPNPGNPYLKDVILPTIKNFNVVDGVGESEMVTTNVGDFRTQNETIAQVLNRLRKDYKLECFFRGNDLIVSGIVYYPNDYLSNGVITSASYDFEQNIIQNDMTYSRSDDLRLGIKAYSVNKVTLGTVNSAGKFKTKQERLEAFVGDADGELRTQFFWNVKDTATLKSLAEQRLNKLKFEGWKGKFTSFGLPFVREGQAISLSSRITPEMNGTYLVKGVEVTFGQNGFRRIIEPHIRIDNNLKITDFINGL